LTDQTRSDVNAPPAVRPTMMRTGRIGYACARAIRDTAGNTAAPAARCRTVFNHVFGTKFRVVEGYGSTQEVILAAKRGEVQGLCASLGQFRSYDRLLKEGSCASSGARKKP
jgi:hypothetical protein